MSKQIILHLNGILADFCSFIICDYRLLLPEPVTYTLSIYLARIEWAKRHALDDDMQNVYPMLTAFSPVFNFIAVRSICLFTHAFKILLRFLTKRIISRAERDDCIAEVLNLWPAVHWWAAAICLVSLSLLRLVHQVDSLSYAI